MPKTVLMLVTSGLLLRFKKLPEPVIVFTAAIAGLILYPIARGGLENGFMKTAWLLLVYRIPREPTAGRVFVWRKLKALGAIALQDAVWVLPRTTRTQEQLQWLAAEITELQGEAILWQAEQLFATDTESLRRQFMEQVEAKYRQILAALKEKDRDLAALSKSFQEVQAQDYFASELGRKTREKLLAAGGD